jgi:5-methylcytosine-specific restriction endonuclease McrA
MSPARMCMVCTQLALPGTSRCAVHALPKRSGSLTRNAKRVVEGATYCYLCGEPARPDDPLVADHVIPRVRGGSDEVWNLAPAHKACNGRKSGKLGGIWMGGAANSRHVATTD